MSQQQEDGQYPRVNSQNLRNHPSGTIISLVGKVISNDGQVACMQTGEEGGNGNVRVMIEPDSFSGKSTHSVLEVVGCLNEDMTITHFINRDMGEDFDLSVYDQMIRLQSDSKYAHIFTP
mmetsp:Transcript_48485/g.58504  ORF Transcript_48485/g.58504 Transcript_48485/m.58504 type:complete len:120 (+) Transcript_48485:135-494(+)